MEFSFKNILNHLTVVALFLIVCSLYFKPYLDGKTLHEGDNVQARGMQTEMANYRNKIDPDKEYFLWTNQSFVGMPSYMVHTMTKPSTFEHVNEYVTLSAPVFRRGPIFIVFRLMLFAYLALLLLNVHWLAAAAMAVSFGLLSNNIIVLDAGHTTKVLALIYVPMLIASSWIAMRKKWLLGSLLFFVLLAAEFKASHIQITYYTFLAIGFIGFGEFIRAFKKKLLPQFFKGALALGLATGIAALSNLHVLWSASEYTPETIRGKSELTKKGTTDGLEKDYIFGWSFGKMETMSLLIPNFMGGSSSESWLSDEKSATRQAFGTIQQTVSQEIQTQVRAGKLTQDQAQKAFSEKLGFIQQRTSKYWGAQPFTAGPNYFGAVMLLLFILGVFTVRGPMKWGILASSFFFILLSWGDNFATFNYAMVDYFPLYNKFRAVTMTLTVLQVLVVLLAGLGVHYLYKYKTNPNLQHPNSLTAKLLSVFKKDMTPANMVLAAGAVTSLICLFGLLYSVVGNLSSPQDLALVDYPLLVSAIQEDRASLIQTDGLKSLGFILAATAALWLYTTDKLNLYLAIGAIGFLSTVDMLIVDRHYVNEKSFVEPAQVAAPMASQADRQVLQDKDPHYRVLDLSRGNPMSGAQTSYFHKSFGGYFAAKPMLYQEVIERYYNNEILGTNKHILDMCNVKYIIQSPEFAVQNPTSLGNSWFVNSVEIVENADAEITALGGLSPKTKAITQQKNAAYVEGLATIPDSVISRDLIYLKSYHPEVMVYESSAATERFAVFSEIYYPPAKGWNVYIDGELQEKGFIKVDYLLRGLRVPAGKHTVEMRFEPRSFILGRTISKGVAILVFLAILGLGFLFYKRIKNIEVVQTEISTNQTETNNPKTTVDRPKEDDPKPAKRKKRKKK